MSIPLGPRFPLRAARHLKVFRSEFPFRSVACKADLAKKVRLIRISQHHLFSRAGHRKLQVV
jgi:hypothetical protein